MTENPPVQVYPNKIKDRIVFKIRTGYKLELLTSEIMKLLGSRKKDVDSDKKSEHAPELETVEVVLVLWTFSKMIINTHKNFYLVFFEWTIWTVKKYFTTLLTMMNTVITGFSFVEVWSTDQASKSLEIEDNVNLTLIIG